MGASPVEAPAGPRAAAGPAGSAEAAVPGASAVPRRTGGRGGPATGLPSVVVTNRRRRVPMRTADGRYRATVVALPAASFASVTTSRSGAYALALPSVRAPFAVVRSSGMLVSQKLFHE